MIYHMKIFVLPTMRQNHVYARFVKERKDLFFPMTDFWQKLSINRKDTYCKEDEDILRRCRIQIKWFI